jgi:protein-disulfide isomerase
MRAASLARVTAAAMLLALVGCGGGGDKPASQPSEAQKQGEAKPQAVTAPATDQKKDAPPAPGPTGSALANLPKKGAADPKVVIIESSEFQCPFCSRVNPTVKQILETYPEDVAFHFFHNPLAFHQQAMPAARAANAAHRQGKFWEMHDKLFENQKDLTDENFAKWAGELGLDVEKFKKDYADPSNEEEVKRQQAAMVGLGARGTPGFFVNGEPLRGAQPFENFKTVIDKQLEATKKIMEEKKLPAAQAWVEVAKTSNPNADNFVKWVVEGGKPDPSAAPPADAAKDGQKPAKRPVDPTVWKVTVDKAKDPMKGGKEPLVTIVEFSEFQCPFCSRVLPTTKQIHETYGDDVAVVFKHNPLPFHKDAPLASEASMAAMEQGKFWEMHDKLFENQKALTRPDLEKYATELGLDMTKFKAALDGGTYKALIAAHQELAGQVNARGTPNFYVNGRQLTGAQPFENFKELIDEELAKAKKLVEGGTPRANVYEEIIKNGKVFKALDDTAHEMNITDSPIMGKPEAKIKIYEFSDFQCPYCSRVGPTLKELKNIYGDDIAIIFKHFPLSFHQEAMPAAKASMAAMKQGKFWEMHDKLFANQKALTQENFETWAKEIGLDVEAFKKDMADPKWEEKVKADMAEGTKAGVKGTPSLFINGRAFQPSGGFNAQGFQQVIDKEILGK